MGLHRKSNRPKREAKYKEQFAHTRANKIRVLTKLVQTFPQNAAYKARLDFWKEQR